MKELFSMFSANSKLFFLFILVIGILNSVLNGAFMYVLGTSLSSTNHAIFKGNYPLFFLLLFIGCIVFNYFFNYHIIRIAANMVSQIELNLIQKIKNAPYRTLCLIKPEEIYATLSNLNSLREAPGRLIITFTSFLTILGCLIYLLCISYIYCLILLMLLGIIISSFFLRRKILHKEFDRQREIQIENFGYLNDLLVGIKDIKMSNTKNENIYSKYIVKNRLALKLNDIKIRLIFSNNSFITNYSWYFLLGAVLFILPRMHNLNTANNAIFLVILIYILTPVSFVTGFFPFYSGVMYAAKGVISVYNKLAKYENTELLDAQKIRLGEFETIRFRDVSFEYLDTNIDSRFLLGPINLELTKGEIIFITGGNGSGKSTFLNLLIGLQKPVSGSIYYNEQLINEDLFVEYRNKMAVVFVEDYLLNHNYENFELTKNNKKFVEYLRLMKLHEVSSTDTIFNDKQKLSKGQQKRLALILALLMDKRILILDEWAAEQDPFFKDYFYQTVIPVFQAENRTIIAITHDDQYLHCADRVIKFRDGRIDSSIYNTNLPFAK